MDAESALDVMMLKVPYHHQLVPGSCGPAALMMVLNYYDSSLVLDRVSELGIWMDSMLWPFLMTDAVGLATAASHYGFRCKIILEKDEFSLHPPGQNPSSRRIHPMTRIMTPSYLIQRQRAVHGWVQFERGAPDVGTIRGLLQAGVPPLVMVDQSRYLKSGDMESVLHWIVAVGSEDGMIIHDPDLGPGLKIADEDFESAMNIENWGLGRRVLVVWT